MRKGKCILPVAEYEKWIARRGDKIKWPVTTDSLAVILLILGINLDPIEIWAYGAEAGIKMNRSGCQFKWSRAEVISLIRHLVKMHSGALDYWGIPSWITLDAAARYAFGISARKWCQRHAEFLDEHGDNGWACNWDNIPTGVVLILEKSPANGSRTRFVPAKSGSSFG